MARHARNPTVIWGAAAMGHPWPSAAKPASCRFTPQITVRLRPSCLTGRSQIKITITSADQKTADFASEKDVRAGATATATATAEPYSVKGGSWLACDGINSVCLMYRGACIAGKLNWSSNPGHRLRCLCRFLLHGYWRQIVVVAVEPDSVVSHEEIGHILPRFFNCRVAFGGHPL